MASPPTVTDFKIPAENTLSGASKLDFDEVAIVGILSNGESVLFSNTSTPRTLSLLRVGLGVPDALAYDDKV